MNIRIDREWLCIEIESGISRWECELNVYIQIHERVFSREWSLLVTCPCCEELMRYDQWSMYDEACPVCHEEYRVWPTGWLKYQVSRVLYWSSLPYHLWVNRPTFDYTELLTSVYWEEIHRKKQAHE